MKNHHLYNIWDQVPVTYYQRGVNKNIFQRIWHKNKINKSKKMIKDVNFQRCLDVGCASGYMISEISKVNNKAKYYGVDAYDKAVDFAKKKYPHIKFKLSPAEKLPYKNHYFDLVLCYETIEHIEDPQASLKEIKRVLHPEGKLILAMDSGNWMFRLVWFIWENTKGKVWKGAHLTPFNHKNLEALIKSVGFKVEKKDFSHLGMEVVFILGK